MKKQASALANAKLNLHLEVLGRRTDGYHNLSSLFQSVTLSDRVVVTVESGNGISVATTNPNIEPNNLCKKAADLFLDRSGKKAKITIHVDNRIPLAAGLAGGSADAAAVLTCLNHLFDSYFSMEELQTMGLTLGADVPFCLIGGTKLVEGIGERFSDAPTFPNHLVVLIKQHQKSSTGDMYQRLDSRQIIPPSVTDTIISHMKQENLEAAFPLFTNHFLAVSEDAAAQQAICRRLKEAGARLTGLTGSGPTVFGLFDFYDGDLIAALKNDYSEVFLCEMAQQGIEME